MEPQVRYVTSADGTKTATWTIGKGTPLVVAPAIWTQPMEHYWLVPWERRHWERLAQRRMVAVYDNRGQGMSDREVTDFSLEARVSDLTAVVEGLHAPTVDIMAMSNSGPVALTYAAKNPERVRRLILTNSAARGRDLRLSDQRRVTFQLVDVDWLLFQRIQALMSYGFTEFAEAVAMTAAASMTPQVFRAATRAAWQFDATEVAGGVTCPTLVLHQRGNDSISIDVAKQIAATIPDSRLGVYEQPHVTLIGSEETIENIEAFLDEDDRGAAAPAEDLPSGTAIILFADIAGSTALTERLGDAAFREKARVLGASLRAVIRECAGTPVEGPTLGDGVLAVFTSAREAIEAARRCGKAGDDAGLPLHLGLHAGDVTREKDPDGRDNVYGGAVEHRGADQRAVGAGRGACVGDCEVAGADVGGGGVRGQGRAGAEGRGRAGARLGGGGVRYAQQGGAHGTW